VSIKQKIRDTWREKYGFEHPQQSKDVKIRTEETNLRKYGFRNVAQSEIIKSKMRRTCQEKYGTDFVFQSESFKAVAMQTSLQKFGVTHHTQREEYRRTIGKKLRLYRQKWKESMICNHGVDSPFKLKSTREACNSDESWRARRETMRRNRSWTTSKPEEKLHEILVEKYADVQRQVPVGRWTMDFYIPSIDMYINLNGAYWHGRGKTEQELLDSSSPRDKVILSTMKRDLRREEWFKENGKKLLIVWEDELNQLMIL
jgi:hypothetical protein